MTQPPISFQNHWIWFLRKRRFLELCSLGARKCISESSLNWFNEYQSFLIICSMLIRHVKIEIPTVNCHSDLLCQTTNRSFKIQGSSVAIQSRSSHLKILFHFIALPDAFLHNNLTQAPKNYSHTFWRVAPKIISILFGGGQNLKNKKNLEKPGKTHTQKKKHISRLFGKGGSGQESLNIVYFLKEEGRIFYFLEEVALFVYSFSKEGVSPKEYNNIASVSRNLAQRHGFLECNCFLKNTFSK